MCWTVPRLPREPQGGSGLPTPARQNMQMITCRLRRCLCRPRGLHLHRHLLRGSRFHSRLHHGGSERWRLLGSAWAARGCDRRLARLIEIEGPGVGAAIVRVF